MFLFLTADTHYPYSVGLATPMKKGHHMGDYIPDEELEKFMAACNDAAAQKAAKETAEKAKIQSDNVGHKLLSKMGWKEGALSLSLSHTHTRMLACLSVACVNLQFQAQF